MKSRMLVLLASALVLGYGTRTEAGTQSDGFGVSLTMLAGPGPTVTITADDMNFGTSAGENKFTTSLVRVTAPNGLAYTIYLDGGQHMQQPLAGQEYRTLANSAGTIPYLLAKDGLGTRWGDDVHTGLGTGVTGSGTGAEQVYTVYGGAQPSIPGSPLPPDGTYTDFVTATVNF